MSTNATEPNRSDSPNAGESTAPKKQRFVKLQQYMGFYLLMFPTLASMAIFGYYPKVDVVVKAFYKWVPNETIEYVGLKNFADAVSDPLFWQSFKVVLIMLVANLFKMWPGIITAIALHRIRSNNWRYIYQVLFVVPMVVPALVWLLIWKSFYDPDFGILNRFLNLTGMMDVLAWLDGSKENPGLMPQIAMTLRPVMDNVLGPLFGGTWGLLAMSGFFIAASSWKKTDSTRFGSMGLLIGLAALIPAMSMTGLAATWPGFIVAGILVVVIMAALAKRVGSGWVLWAFLIFGGIWCVTDAMWRLPILLALAFAGREAVAAISDHVTSSDNVRNVGLALLLIACGFITFGMIWTEPLGQFAQGTPAWLGHQDLILPSLIMWGFPWVGTVGVLIYLAGLQQISNDVYEAAELDGVGPTRMLFQIELPLIMTQVRINLIFMTIGTLTAYEFFLILLGPEGGPGRVGIVPGLYMYQVSFIDNRYGYACALGMVLFVMILLLTVVYQRYIKVDK